MRAPRGAAPRPSPRPGRPCGRRRLGPTRSVGRLALRPCRAGATPAGRAAPPRPRSRAPGAGWPRVRAPVVRGSWTSAAADLVWPWGQANRARRAEPVGKTARVSAHDRRLAGSDVTPAFAALSAAVSTACGVREPRAVEGSVEWHEFLRLVDRHRVAPLVQSSGWFDQGDAPPEVREAVLAIARRAGAKSLRALALARDAIAALADAGVSAVVLKGVALAAGAYGSVSARAVGDVDVLVAPDAVRAAVDALREAGFEWLGFHAPRDPERYEQVSAVLDRPARFPLRCVTLLARDELRLELHWRLFVNSRLMSVDPGWVEAPEVVDVGGVPLPTLPAGAEWMYVLVHGSNHFWARMQWLADVTALARVRPELAQVEWLEAAARGGYGPPVAAALLLAEAVF